MSWSWRRTPPGMVRLSHKRLIELYRSALRAEDLKSEIRLEQARTARFVAQFKVAQAQLDGALTLPEGVVADLLDSVPLTAEGRFHDRAFDLLLEQAIWREREQPVLRLLRTSGNQGGHDAG